MPVLQPAGGAVRPMGRRAYGRQDDELPVASSGAGRQSRVPGVDGGRAAEALALCMSAIRIEVRLYRRGQSSEGAIQESHLDEKY